MIILVGYNLLLWLLILLNNVVHFSLAIDRLKSADDAFRRQLEDKVQAFQEQITELEHDKQVEVDQANLRVRELTIYFWGLDTQKIAEIILKFELCGFTIEKCVQTLQTAWQTADQDQIAPKRSLSWVYTVCPDLSIQKYKIITVCNHCRDRDPESPFWTQNIPSKIGNSKQSDSSEL